MAFIMRNELLVSGSCDSGSEHFHRNCIEYREFTCADRVAIHEVKHLEFIDCIFDNCVFSPSLENIENMPQVMDVIFNNCEDKYSYIGPCYIQNVIIDGLKTADICIIWGALFSHVVLKGKIGHMKINTLFEASSFGTPLQVTLDEKREDFYHQVDWALDISQVRPLSLEIEGIPTRCIIRDPETQVVISKKKFYNQSHSRAIAYLHEDVKFPLMEFLRSNTPEIILIAPTGRTKSRYQKILDSFAELGKLGFLE